MQVGPIGTNCYILEDETTGKAAVIDPGDEAERILAALKEGGAEVTHILLTHGHYDHTTAVPELEKALPQAAIYIHRGDANGAGNTLFPLAGQVAGLNFYDEGDHIHLHPDNCNQFTNQIYLKSYPAIITQLYYQQKSQ